MTTRQKRKNEHLERGEYFRKKARKIIDEVTELHKRIRDKTQNNTSVLVDEFLHSIFFLGKIHDPPFSPKEILNNEVLKSHDHQSFKLCSSQLPRRSPFSCVLDMMVHLAGQENEEEIRNELKKFITEVEKSVPSKRSRRKDKRNKKDLISTAICVSQNPNGSVRHYGVSMSTSGSHAGKIMVAASCLSAWDDYVAGAVMTYYPEKSKKPYFDGTIKIPDNVTCQTFDLQNREEMQPCKSCSNMFGLNTDVTKESDYGNCAEAESLSKLLENDGEVKKQSRPTSDTWTSENIERAREDVREKLDEVLGNVKSKFEWDGHFYTPQRSSGTADGN